MDTGKIESLVIESMCKVRVSLNKISIIKGNIKIDTNSNSSILNSSKTIKTSIKVITTNSSKDILTTQGSKNRNSTSILTTCRMNKI